MMVAIAAFTLTSCEDVPAPYGFPEESGGKEVIPIGDPEGAGLKEDPFNVSAALTMVKAMKDGEVTEEIYVKGIVSTVSEVSVENGNATYFISDDGTANNELEVYRGKYLGGKAFTSEDQIKVGDVVIVKGKCKNFKGNTPEFDTGSIIYMINDDVMEEVPLEEPTGTGVKDDPYNVSAALSIITKMKDGETTDVIYVKGKISTISEVSVENGNATYFISDDGNATNELEVYRGKYLGGKAFSSKDQIKVGDEVIVKGVCKNFKGNTPEFDTGNEIYMINGEVVEEVPLADPTGTGVQNDPYNVSAALSIITAMNKDDLTDEIYVKGIISTISKVETEFGNATYCISDDGKAANELQVYRGLYIDGAPFTSESQIKVGDEVVVKGQCKNFMGNTPEFDAGSQIYSLNGQSADNGIKKTVEGNIVTFVDNSITASDLFSDDIYLNTQGWEDKQKEGLSFYTNMSRIEFAIGEGTTSPTYYDSTAGVRMYAKNVLNVGGGNLKIAKVILTCENANYVGNGQLAATAEGTMMTICNDFSSAKGGTQLRVQRIQIFYEKMQ